MLYLDIATYATVDFEGIYFDIIARGLCDLHCATHESAKIDGASRVRATVDKQARYPPNGQGRVFTRGMEPC